MGLIALIVLGGIAGWIASMVMHPSNGVLGDVILGIVGALVGGIIMNLLGNAGVTGFNVYSLIVAIIGSVVLIRIGRLIYK